MFSKILNSLLSKRIIIAIAFISIVSFTYAQKYAYVDTDYILQNIPEYTDAQDQLNEMSKIWQEEIEAEFAEVEKMYKDYQAEAVLLPEDLKKKREDQIINKEREIKELQNKRFGPEGDLFIKRQELIKPIQEKIYNAIEEIATTKNYAFVFDKGGSLTLLYTNPKYDISDDILDEISSVMQTVRREDRKHGGSTQSTGGQDNSGSKRK